MWRGQWNETRSQQESSWGQGSFFNLFSVDVLVVELYRSCENKVGMSAGWKLHLSLTFTSRALVLVMVMWKQSWRRSQIREEAGGGHLRSWRTVVWNPRVPALTMRIWGNPLFSADLYFVIHENMDETVYPLNPFHLWYLKIPGEGGEVPRSHISWHSLPTSTIPSLSLTDLWAQPTGFMGSLLNSMSSDFSSSICSTEVPGYPWCPKLLLSGRGEVSCH